MDGTLHTVDGRPMLRFERRLPHPVGKVWRAIIDPRELSGWFPWRIEMDFRIDGKISFTHPTGAVTAPDAVITELDPQRFGLVPQEFGTRVVLTVSADTPGRLPAVQRAWRDHLESFADQLDDRA